MPWINLLLIALVLLGHAAILVAVLNRVYALPFRRPVLECFRRTHDVLMLVFPVGLVWFVAVHSPRLLSGGHWSEAPWPLQVYGAACIAAVAIVALVLARRVVSKLPHIQLSNDSRTIDVAARLGYRPLDRNRWHPLAYVPGNELFRVEVSEKVYRHPRLPAQWDGLSIAHLSDLHYIGTVERAFFEQAAEIVQELNADLIALTGDLVDKPQFIDWLGPTMGRLTAPLGCYYVLGNHDYELPDVQAMRDAMMALGWTDLGSRCVTRQHAGRPMVLAGTERPWLGRHPDFAGTPRGAFRILLSHTPDHFAWARRRQVDVMLAGHNHGGQVRLPVYGPVYGPSLYGCRYASGPFWNEPTLLYVSRGLSGRHPLRWRCPPEITKLVLRSGQAG